MLRDDMEGTIPKQRARKEEVLLSGGFLKVRVPGAEGAVGWQPPGNGWRAHTPGPCLVGDEHRQQEDRAEHREAR